MLGALGGIMGIRGPAELVLGGIGKLGRRNIHHILLVTHGAPYPQLCGSPGFALAVNEKGA